MNEAPILRSDAVSRLSIIRFHPGILFTRRVDPAAAQDRHHQSSAAELFGWKSPCSRLFAVGMIWVDGLHYSPMAFLLMDRRFRAMDPAARGVSTMSGANIFHRVPGDLKLTWPAILATLLMLLRARDRVLEVPALLGSASGSTCSPPRSTRACTLSSQIGLASAYGMTCRHHDVGAVLRLAPVEPRQQVRDLTAGLQRADRPRPWRWAAPRSSSCYLSPDRGAALCGAALVLVQRFYSVPSWQALNNLTPTPTAYLHLPNLALGVEHPAPFFASATVIMLVTSSFAGSSSRPSSPGDASSTTSPRCRWSFGAGARAFDHDLT